MNEKKEKKGGRESDENDGGRRARRLPDPVTRSASSVRGVDEKARFRASTLKTIDTIRAVRQS